MITWPALGDPRGQGLLANPDEHRNVLNRRSRHMSDSGTRGLDLRLPEAGRTLADLSVLIRPKFPERRFGQSKWIPVPFWIAAALRT